MESRPSSNQDGSLSGDIRIASTPVGMPLNYQEDLQIDANPTSDNKSVKSTALDAADSLSTETPINTKTNRFRGKQGRIGKNVGMPGIKGNDEMDGEERASSRGLRRRDSKWEVLSNLESGTQYTIRPKKSEGYLAKRRRWPLKGWHKR